MTVTNLHKFIYFNARVRRRFKIRIVLITMKIGIIVIVRKSTTNVYKANISYSLNNFNFILFNLEHNRRNLNEEKFETRMSLEGIN